jgi:hypothetical protein
MDLTLNQKLRFEFSALDLKGTKIESFYKKRFQMFLFKNTREISGEKKMEYILLNSSFSYKDPSRPTIEGETIIDKLKKESGANNKPEPETMIIQDDLSERTFIQGEIIRSENYLKEVTLEDRNREKLNLWIDFLRKTEKKNPEKSKKTLSFADLFREKDNAKLVKNIFETKGYTINGKWKGLSEQKSELLCAYNVLKPLLKPGLKPTPTTKIFYKEFGLPENYISDRMLTKEPFNEIRTEFESVFSALLQSKK